MKFTISTSKEKNRNFRFNLSDEWFEKKFDYKKIESLKLECILYEDENEEAKGETVLELSDEEYSIKNLELIYKEDDFDKFVNAFCDIDVEVSDEKFNTLTEDFKKSLKEKNLLIFTDLNHPLVMGFAQIVYSGDEEPEEDVDYFYMSPDEVAILNGEEPDEFSDAVS